MKQQITAVEWLEKQFDKYTSAGVRVPNDKIFKLTEKAKEMEKEQIMQSYNDGKSAVIHIEENKSLEQYYNETYKNK